MLIVYIFFLSVLSCSGFANQDTPKRQLPSDQIIEFVRSESENNKVKILHQQAKPFNTKMIAINHFEIPLDRKEFWLYDRHRTWFENPDRRSPFGLLLAITEALPTDIKDALIFERDGQRYLRWLLSPDDRTYGKLIKKYFRALGVDIEKKKDFFRGIRTASRSIIAVLPNGHAFSFKPSTDRTSQGDYWLEQRPYPARWVSLNVQLSEYFRKFSTQFKYLDVAWEAAGFAIPPVAAQGARFGGGDIGFSIRLMEETQRGFSQEYSGFIWSDRKFAEQLAREAGMKFSDFWQEAFFIKGQAMAELAAITGFKFTSAHSQNFRFIIDRDSKRISKVRVLDLTDGQPMTEIFTMNGAHKLLSDWHDFSEKVNKPLKQTFALSWFMRYLDVEMPRRYKEAYMRGVKQRLKQLTSLNLNTLRWADTAFKNQFEDNFIMTKIPKDANPLDVFHWRKFCQQISAQLPPP